MSYIPPDGRVQGIIVAAWIAVVYYLLAKNTELALGGDAEPQRITNEMTAHLETVASTIWRALQHVENS